MNAAIIAIGSEMLGIGRVETNSLAITALLERYGVTLRRKSVIGDDPKEIAAELRLATQRADVVFICGGLGPTEDDLTKDVVADVFDLQLVLDESVLQKIRDRFTARGVTMAEINRKQALVFAGHETLRNDRGTAPGFHLRVGVESRECDLWLFPGVPYEMEGLLASAVEPWLGERLTASMKRRVLKVVGLPESRVEELIGPYYAAHRGEEPTILAGGGEIQIHVAATGDAADEILAARLDELKKLIGDFAYGTDGDTLESVVGKLLLERNATVATAESCTGGLLSSRITDVSGSSSYFMGGVISYTREAKIGLVGVDAAAIDANGEVSEEVATQMARGVRSRFATTYGIAITGIAGPTGGTPTKPVGTVHIAVASSDAVRHHKALFSGSRTTIKRQSTQYALDLLRRMILGI